MKKKTHKKQSDCLDLNSPFSDFAERLKSNSNVLPPSIQSFLVDCSKHLSGEAINVKTEHIVNSNVYEVCIVLHPLKYGSFV